MLGKKAFIICAAIWGCSGMGWAQAGPVLPNSPASYIKVSSLAGQNLGERIALCVANLPASGGVCDARDYTGAPVLTVLTISKPVVLLFNAGMFTVKGTITFRKVAAVRVAGIEGSPTGQGTTFRWAGDSASPMFNLENVRDSSFEDFGILSSPSAPLAVAVRSGNDVRGMTPTRDTFRDLVIDGTNRGGLGKGFQFTLGAGGDANNDLARFFNVEVVNYTIAGWSFEHPQSKGHQFFGCSFNGDRFGEYGVTTALGPRGGGGSFMWFGGNGGGNTGADFYLGPPDDTILISGGNFESSSRLLVTEGASSNAFPITIEDVRWSGDALAADGKAIIYTQRGPLNLFGNLIGEFPAKPLKISFDPSASPALALALGNVVNSSLPQPFAGNGKGTWNLISNIQNSHPVEPIQNRLNSAP